REPWAGGKNTVGVQESEMWVKGRAQALSFAHILFQITPPGPKKRTGNVTFLIRLMSGVLLRGKKTDSRFLYPVNRSHTQSYLNN
ncbi:MAG: hypothetical protein O3B01_31455, partial [Planctomycetota bacterium]|nr:hypothetical protein [Planctomycetota bacterium]